MTVGGGERLIPGSSNSFARSWSNELMAARRAVRDAKSPLAIRRSRCRVNDAKLALGERGRGWWLPATPVAANRSIEAALRALLLTEGSLSVSE